MMLLEGLPSCSSSTSSSKTVVSVTKFGQLPNASVIGLAYDLNQMTSASSSQVSTHKISAVHSYSCWQHAAVNSTCNKTVFSSLDA